MDYVGEKYEDTKNLDLKDIGKLVREEIESKVKSNGYPDFNYVLEAAVRDGYPTVFIRAVLPNEQDYWNYSGALRKELLGIINQYNYRDKNHSGPIRGRFLSLALVGYNN